MQNNLYMNNNNIPDAYGCYPANPVYPTTSNPVTGTEKLVIKQDANGFTTKEKSSYHNPVTGVSETYKAKVKGDRSRSRSRSNSSERNRRNMVGYQYGNVPMPNNQMPMNNYVPVNNQVPIRTDVPMMNGPVYNQPANYYNPTDLYAQEKGKIKTTENMVKTSEKLNYVDPVTGAEQSAKIKTKVIGDRSRSKSNGKSKTTYTHKI